MTVSDKIEHFNGAIIHHGPFNDRIYLMKIGDAVPENISIQLKEKAKQHGYSKIFARIPTRASDAFLKAGFEIEAEVPKLYLGVEDAVKNQSIQTAYTIARAISPGMNITFAQSGYQYGGRLVNNTNISGRIESMNVWYKSIKPL